MLENNSLIWCMKQRKGIRIIEPNLNLTEEYLKKAISALNTMNAALQIRETDWILTTAYYARYFALYALLMKLGIKSGKIRHKAYKEIAMNYLTPDVPPFLEKYYSKFDNIFKEQSQRDEFRLYDTGLLLKIKRNSIYLQSYYWL